MKSLRILLLLLLLFLVSCSKDDKKPEYVDETKTTESEKKDEKSDTSKNTPKDTSSKQQQTSSNKTPDNNSSNKKEFLNDEPVAVISPLNAGDYNGKTVTVKGYVADVYKSDKVAYLNFVEKYPDNPFTAVIFASKFNDFPEIEKYKSKNVEVTGRVSIYRGKPQIILNSPSQIKD